jgi:hypothetical protein
MWWLLFSQLAEVLTASLGGAATAGKADIERTSPDWCY